MGVSVSEGTVTQWLKAIGESVAADEPLLEISTDKVDTEVPSPAAGILVEIHVQEGDTVDVGTVRRHVAGGRRCGRSASRRAGSSTGCRARSSTGCRARSSARARCRRARTRARRHERQRRNRRTNLPLACRRKNRLRAQHRRRNHPGDGPRGTRHEERHPLVRRVRRGERSSESTGSSARSATSPRRRKRTTGAPLHKRRRQPPRPRRASLQASNHSDLASCAERSPTTCATRSRRRRP